MSKLRESAAKRAAAFASRPTAPAISPASPGSPQAPASGDASSSSDAIVPRTLPIGSPRQTKSASEAVAFRSDLCAVREIDDQTADRIHDEDTAKRAAKRPFSLAMQLSTMMKSGRYSSQADLAHKLGRSASVVSRLLKLYDDSPIDLWSKVKDPTALKYRDIEFIIKAYQKPAFSDWARLLDSSPVTSAQSLIKKAKELTARPRPEKSTVDKIREVKRGDNFHIVLPKAIPFDARAKILAYAKGLVSS